MNACTLYNGAKTVGVIDFLRTLNFFRWK